MNSKDRTIEYVKALLSNPAFIQNLREDANSMMVSPLTIYSISRKISELENQISKEISNNDEFMV